jgi:hypothetical protein
MEMAEESSTTFLFYVQFCNLGKKKIVIYNIARNLRMK